MICMHDVEQESEHGAQEEAFPALRLGDMNSVIRSEPVVSTYKQEFESWFHLNELTGAGWSSLALDKVTLLGQS